MHQVIVPIVGPSFTEAQGQIERANRLADWVEVRVDRLKAFDLDALKKLCLHSRLPVILTDLSQLGAEERVHRTLQLAALNPAFIDVRDDILARVLPLVPKEVKVLAAHHGATFPADLDGLLARLTLPEVSWRKIAVPVNSCEQALRLLTWSRDKSNLIAIGMGEGGLATRVTAPMSFASIETGLESAPGQVTVNELVQTYRYRLTNRDTSLLGVLGGSQVSKSLGKLVHNAFFTQWGLNAVYLPFILNEVGPFLRLAASAGAKGFSVTMPFKEVVIPLCDELDPLARAMGAVNTLVRRDNRWIGYNTDGIGALVALEKVGPVAGKRLVILGAGGASKAIAYEARRRGAVVMVLNRTVEKGDGPLSALGSIPYDILVQATSVGSASNEAPIDLNHLRPGTVVMDIITRPRETVLLKKAKDLGCTVVEGREMWIYQAVEQLALWFDLTDREAIYDSVARVAHELM